MGSPEIGEKLVGTAELPGTCEARDDGEVSVVGVGEFGVEFSGELEDLDGEV